MKRSLEPNSLQSRQYASAESCWRQGSPGKDQLNDHADIERESFLLLGKDEVDHYGETGNRYLGRYLA
jgi:hypothetical protein